MKYVRLFFNLMIQFKDKFFRQDFIYDMYRNDSNFV